MALRDAVRSVAGVRVFAARLHEFLFGQDPMKSKFTRWCDALANLPRKQTRKAAEQYGFPIQYQSRPNWVKYSRFLDFARTVRRDLSDLRPRDIVDIQSFL